MPKGCSNTTTDRGGRSCENVSSFESFFEGWLVRQEHYIDELMSSRGDCNNSNRDDLKELINRVLAHYQQYYEEKSRLAQRNVFLLFCPPWFTSFERSFFWVAGFKPGLAFRIVNDGVNDLNDGQRARLNRLREETRLEEKLLNDELAKVQESVAGPQLMELARERGRMGTDETAEFPQVLKRELVTIVSNADWLRTNTVVKIVEILNPVQNVEFLAKAAQLQLKIRSCGLNIDAERRESYRNR